MEKPRKILRPKAVYEKCGCGKTKFDEEYRYYSDGDPNVPGTDIPRLKPIPLGARNIGYLEHEADKLIDALAKLRDRPKAVKAARLDHNSQSNPVRKRRAWSKTGQWRVNAKLALAPAIEREPRPWLTFPPRPCASSGLWFTSIDAHDRRREIMRGSWRRYHALLIDSRTYRRPRLARPPPACRASIGAEYSRALARRAGPAGLLGPQPSDVLRCLDSGDCFPGL
jgi:predicted DNA-binding transcriptional regulator AlpA